jgi:hypothetical protein
LLAYAAGLVPATLPPQAVNASARARPDPVARMDRRVNVDLINEFSFEYSPLGERRSCP